MRSIVTYIELFILITLALISDIKTYKIKNVIVLSFIIMGLVTNFYLNGITGLISSLWGVIVPVLLLIILYFLRMLGAGDIKLFSAIGAIMGIEFVVYTITYSFVCGGVIALIIMLVRKNAKERLQHLFYYIKNCIMTFSLQPYTDFKNKKDGAKFRFAYAIACGVVVCIILLHKVF